MPPRQWYTDDLYEVIKRIPNAKIVNIFGGLRSSGYLTISSKGTLYRVRMSAGEWTPSITAECPGDLSDYVRPQQKNRAA